METVPMQSPEHEWRGILGRLAEAGESTDVLAVIEQSGARDARSVLSLLVSFPTLAQRGLIDAPDMSARLASVVGRKFFEIKADIESADEMKEGLPRSLGAMMPSDALWKIGDEVRSTKAAYTPITRGVADDDIDLRVCLPWPVRNQGHRGTCVSFATTALMERFYCSSYGASIDFSEQFLYWAIKMHGNDGRPNEDGTWLENAIAVVGSHGVAEEKYWPYNPNAIPGNISHGSPGSPSELAINDAASRRMTAVFYEGSPRRAAGDVLRLLKQGRPVAICLPVFEDPISKITNWDTAVGVQLGIVLDPPPTSVMKGGHAVCVTGFVSDADEPKGGYFVIRNSWSTVWGQLLPAAGAYGPEPGYGQVSATYVDRYMSEYAAL